MNVIKIDIGHYWVLIPVLFVAIFFSWSDLLFGCVSGFCIFIYRDFFVRDLFTVNEICIHTILGIFFLLITWLISDFHAVPITSVDQLPIGMLKNVYFLFAYCLMIAVLGLLKAWFSEPH